MKEPFDLKDDKKYRNYKWLKHKYVDEKQSTYQIAEECNVTQEAISYWINKFKIKKLEPKYKSYDWFFNLFGEKSDSKIIYFGGGSSRKKLKRNTIPKRFGVNR